MCIPFDLGLDTRSNGKLNKKPPSGGFLLYNRLMNNCNCDTAGMVAPASRYNKAQGKCNQSCDLTTVVIPKSKGSDAAGQPLAPVNGAYSNTIVTYLASGSIYIYDSHGIYTSLTGSSIVPILEQLQAQMETLTSTVNTTQTDLTTETQNRISAQTDLQATITALQKALNTETNARETADAELNTLIEALQTDSTNNTQGLAAEVTARTEADTALQAQISNLSLNKQDELVSGATIKTINGQSVLGEGDIPIEGGGTSVTVVQSTGQSTTDVMSQKAVTDALNDSAGVTGASLSSSSTDNQITLTTTIAGEPDYTRVDVKTINGESIIGEGDLEITGGVVKAVGESLILSEEGTLTTRLQVNRTNPSSTGSSITVPANGTATHTFYIATLRDPVYVNGWIGTPSAYVEGRYISTPGCSSTWWVDNVSESGGDASSARTYGITVEFTNHTSTPVTGKFGYQMLTIPT